MKEVRHLNGKNRLLVKYPYPMVYLLACLFGCILPKSTGATELVEVTPLTESIIMLHFDEGYVNFHQRGELRTNESVIIDPLDISGATSLSTYNVSSSTDNNYIGGVTPVDLGRKTKGNQFAWLCESWRNKCVNSSPDHVKEHWVYLYLPTPLQQGTAYTVSTGNLASNTNSVTFVYDITQSRSEAVHVNQIGYSPEAEDKFGYVYHWLGDKGGLDLSWLVNKNFYLVRTTDNAVAYTGLINFRKSATNIETGQNDPTETPNRNFIGTDVYECDFSSFNTEGEYVLVVEGVGRSFPFRIDEDAYREPFTAVMRGLYHNRSGIALTEPYTNFTRPAPHNPSITPGFSGVLKYTTSRRIDWIGAEDSENKAAIEAGILGPIDTWGWYQDAGDWDGYFTHSKVPVTLLFLYQFGPEKFADNEFNIPESGNGTPDLLDEALWLVRFYHRTRHAIQDAGYGTGGVGGSRVSGDWFGDDTRADGTTKASYDDIDRTWIISGEDPFMTYKYAGLAAQAAHCLQLAGVQDPEGIDWLQEAIDAYNWAQNNSLPGDETIVMEGKRLRDQRAYAAAGLYRLTGDQAYHNQFISDVAWITTSTWLEEDQIWAPYVYATIDNQQTVDTQVESRLKQSIQATAERHLGNHTDNRACRYGGIWDFPMLIGQATTPMIFEGIAGYVILKDENPGWGDDLLRRMYTTSDYFLGNNPVNQVWITGVGERSPEQAFHMDAWYNGTGQFHEGIVPYGPWRVEDDRPQGPWSHDWANKSLYPAIDSWPGHERWFNQRYGVLTSEFTVHQNQRQAAAVYGFLVAGNTTPPEPDTEAPTSPTNLTADSKTENSVGLSWDASTDNVLVTEYDVFVDDNLAASTTNTNQLVTELTPNTTYSFSVRAKDAAGNVSDPSEPLVVTTLAADTEAPSVPTNLTSTGKTDTSVNLEWSPSSDNVGVTEYDIYVDGSFRVSSSGPSVTIDNLSAGSSYTFAVLAKDAAGNQSGLSNSISVTTEPAVIMNIALNKPITSSSSRGKNVTENANDGNVSTSWESQNGMPQWISVDLQDIYDISQISINWNDPYGIDYTIESSNDNSNWVSVYNENSGNGGSTIINQTFSAQYVRVFINSSSNSRNVVLDELEIYGSQPSGARTTSSNSSPLKDDILVYPNPVAGNFTIDLKKGGIPTEITIISLNGQRIYNKKNVLTKELTVDVGNISEGVYTIKIMRDNKITTTQISIK